MIALIDSANKKKPASKLIDAGLDGGESGVRTHGPLKTSVFKTDAIDHSAISPKMEPGAGFEPTLWSYPSALQKRCLRPLGDPGSLIMFYYKRL